MVWFPLVGDWFVCFRFWFCRFFVKVHTFKTVLVTFKNDSVAFHRAVVFCAKDFIAFDSVSTNGRAPV